MLRPNVLRLGHSAVLPEIFGVKEVIGCRDWVEGLGFRDMDFGAGFYAWIFTGALGIRGAHRRIMAVRIRDSVENA